MVIHKGSKNPDLAHRFIDFMLDGRNASELTNQIGTGTPNAAALPFIKPEIKTLAALFPDAATQARLEPLKDLNSRQRRALNKLWTEISCADPHRYRRRATLGRPLRSVPPRTR